VAALAPTGSADAEALERRKAAASKNLGASVAALEGLRLDLLRLHGGADNLAPITTLIQSAKELSDDATRLADAQREVDEALAQPNFNASASPRLQ
jgi:serine/threonine-protein kinase